MQWSWQTIVLGLIFLLFLLGTRHIVSGFMSFTNYIITVIYVCFSPEVGLVGWAMSIMQEVGSLNFFLKKMKINYNNNSSGSNLFYHT